jgi:tetratricopeptide (TPR) repeat protein
MNSMGPGPLKPRLLALVAQGQAEQQAFIARLSAAERAAMGAPDAWSAKDHIAHNTAWKADAVREISVTVRGETPEPTPSITVFNPRVFAEQRHQSWAAILTDAAQADASLRATLEACSEADLSDPARFPWREGLPLWCTALVSGYEHPAEHYAQFYLEMGDVARARTVREEAIETARRFIGDTEEFGYMVYNLGCFYANIGQPGLALATIRESFASAPQLREGIREDPELVSLRDDPAFQAFVADAGTPQAAEQRNP